jgi:hypothetical protein
MSTPDTIDYPMTRRLARFASRFGFEIAAFKLPGTF